MSCRKSCEKLWNNYLNKYGDYRERLQLIRNDRQCFKQFRLSRIRQIRKPLSAVDSNRNLKKKCDPLLPSECCHSSIMKNNRLFPLDKTDLDKLEKIIEDENFPDNIFPVNIKTRSTSLLDSIIQDDERLSMYLSIQKSEPGTTTYDPTITPTKNPYAQLIERLRQAENSNTKTVHKSADSTINTNTYPHLQNFLSFLHTLGDTSSFDENTLIALFSIDNHLSSSIYIPTNIQQLKIIPKTILHSLENKQILNQIEIDNKSRELNSNLSKDSYYQILNSTDQDNELNFKLFNTYTIKAFKDFLIHRNKPTRLPKLFYDIDHYHRK